MYYKSADMEEHDYHDDMKSPYLHKNDEVRIVAGITCGLSVIGSLLIILSYLCFRGLRSRARQILVHISIMDFGVGVTNLLGLTMHYDKYFKHTGCSIGSTGSCAPNVTIIKNVCLSQACFASFFTYGSVLWTICLSVYLYFLIVHNGGNRAKYTLCFSYIFCYLMPLLLTLWLLMTSRLGYAPYSSAGWCGIILKDPVTGHKDRFASSLGYDLWICLAIILVPILSISVHIFIKLELKRSQSFHHSERYHQALQNVDYKFLLIPVVFVILRVWSCIVTLLFIYIGMTPSQIHSQGVVRALINLSGIGDSGQGFANAILFVLFTKRVREKFVQCICCKRNRGSIQYANETQRLLNSRRPRGKRTIKISQSLEHTPPPTE